MGFLAAATVGYLSGAIVAQMDVQPISRILVDWMSSMLVMAGHLGVFIAVMSFGRHVYLDSQGLLPARAVKPRRTRLRARSPAAERSRNRRKAADETVPESPPEEPAADPVEPSPQNVRPVLTLGGAIADESPEESEEDEHPDDAGWRIVAFLPFAAIAALAGTAVHPASGMRWLGNFHRFLVVPVDQTKAEQRPASRPIRKL